MAPKGSKVAPAKGKSGDKKKKAHSKPKSAAERDAARGDQIENLADKLQASAAKREQKQKSKRKRKNKKNVFTKYWERMFGADEEIRLNPKTKGMVAALMITENEVQKMKAIYNEVDINGAGEMDFDEFFELLGEPRSPFTDAIFTIVDDREHTHIELLTPEERRVIEAEEGPGSALCVRGHLTFDDFLQTVCTFCMYSQDDILLFTFNAFDADNSGVIDEGEFMQLCIVVNDNKPTYPDNFKLALTSFDKNEDGMMDFDEFKDLNNKFPMLLFPAFRFQDKVQSKILGRPVWMDIARRVQQERERESYKRTHGGAEPPKSFSEKYLSCFTRQKTGSRRARKPPSAKDTAIKKASQQNPKTASTADDSSSSTSSTSGAGSGRRREARGASGATKGMKKASAISSSSVSTSNSTITSSRSSRG